MSHISALDSPMFSRSLQLTRMDYTMTIVLPLSITVLDTYDICAEVLELVLTVYRHITDYITDTIKNRNGGTLFQS